MSTVSSRANLFLLSVSAMLVFYAFHVAVLKSNLTTHSTPYTMTGSVISCAIMCSDTKTCKLFTFTYGECRFWARKEIYEANAHSSIYWQKRNLLDDDDDSRRFQFDYSTMSGCVSQRPGHGIRCTSTRRHADHPSRLPLPNAALSKRPFTRVMYFCTLSFNVDVGINLQSTRLVLVIVASNPTFYNKPCSYRTWRCPNSCTFTIRRGSVRTHKFTWMAYDKGVTGRTTLLEDDVRGSAVNGVWTFSVGVMVYVDTGVVEFVDAKQSVIMHRCNGLDTKLPLFVGVALAEGVASYFSR